MLPPELPERRRIIDFVEEEPVVTEQDQEAPPKRKVYLTEMEGLLDCVTGRADVPTEVYTPRRSQTPDWRVERQYQEENPYSPK